MLPPGGITSFAVVAFSSFIVHVPTIVGATAVQSNSVGVAVHSAEPPAFVVPDIVTALHPASSNIIPGLITVIANAVLSPTTVAPFGAQLPALAGAAIAPNTQVIKIITPTAVRLFNITGSYQRWVD